MSVNRAFMPTKKPCALSILLLLFFPAAVRAATFTVTTTADGGIGSLRWAITNANFSPGPNNIVFNIGTNVVETIAPLNPLPVITQPVVIDGYTEPGSTSNTLALGDNANILISITGNSMTNNYPTNYFSPTNYFVDRNCFVTVTNNCVFRGMNLNYFLHSKSNYVQTASAILLSNVYNCVVEGNFIGTDPPGRIGEPNGCGVFVLGGGNNLIGGTNLYSRNLIACNLRDTRVTASTNNLIVGNFYGVPAVFPAAFIHTPEDISLLIENGSCSNLVGGVITNARNFFCNEPVAAVEIDESPTNWIYGNWLGVSPQFLNASANFSGVRVSNSWAIAVGGAQPGQGNLISANQQGVWMSGALATQNTVAGNFIGTGPNGTNALHNSIGVILDSGACSNLIGGASVTARNLISGNTYQGVLISSNGTSFNIVSNNYIGVDLTGTNALANNDGVTLNGGASGNFVLGNLISANASDGIVLDGATTTNNIVQENSLGPDSTGLEPPVTSVFFNTYSPVYQGCGVRLQNGAAWNLTGGYAAGQGNTIAFSAGDGVLVTSNATHDAIIGNSIHDNFGLGINLQPPGEGNSTVTPNHPGGGTSGPNELLNFPILTNASYTPTTTLISGAITNGQPSQNFSVEFYANTTNDPSGNGQGKIYLGHTNITTDVSGNASFNFAAAGYLAQNYLAATATAQSGATPGSTSEFGPDFLAPVPQVVITKVMQSGTNFVFGFQTYTGQSYTI